MKPKKSIRSKQQEIRKRSQLPPGAHNISPRSSLSSSQQGSKFSGNVKCFFLCLYVCFVFVFFVFV